MAGRKGRNKKEKVSAKTIVISIAIIILLVAIALVVFYVSNGNSFDGIFDGFIGSSGNSAASDSLKEESQDSTKEESGSESQSESQSQSSKEDYNEEFELIETSKDLKITFMDIGQGDSILIEFPDGKNMLIDSGDKRNASKAVFDKYLKDKDGNKLKLDYCVTTHPDSDHIGMMDYIYREYDVGKSYRPYVYSTYKDSSVFDSTFNAGINIKASSQTYYKYLQGVYDEGTYWEFFNDDSDFINSFTDLAGKELFYKVDFVMPYVSSNLEGFSNFKTPNDFSAIIMLEYAGKRVLFTGDIENETGKNSAENLFVNYYSKDSGAVDCDVLKVAHHGSDSSSSSQFLSVVKPEYSVISCGLSNKHRHPLKSTLDNLITAHSKIYRTDLQGTITLRINAKGQMKFEIQTDKYDDMLLDDGDAVKKYETEHSDEIEKYKASL